jgi:hypothetical protein
MASQVICSPVQTSLSSLSVAQLRRAVAIKQQIASLEQELAGVLGAASASRAGAPKRKIHMSAAARARIAAAQRARWAKFKRAKNAKAGRKAAPKLKRKVSAAARAKLSAIAKARWAKVKASGKARL